MPCASGLNPSKLLSYSLTPSDVINAVKAQNKQVSLGEVGGKPIRDGQQMNVTIKAQKQLTSVPEFERILLRVNPDGSAVRLRDVARVELGQESYTSSARYNGKPAAGVGIKLASDANALNTSNAVAAFIEDMRPYFPHGVEVVSPYDTVPFIKISIIEVVKTLLEAIVLVFAVIYLFLQNFRATIIPSLAVPVVLLGTFGVMAAFGFSINTLTMFGMVLAIGLLVDDAHRRGRKRGPRHGRGRAASARGHHQDDGPDHPARSSAWRRCCPPYSCRWPFSAAPSAPSTASSR